VGIGNAGVLIAVSRALSAELGGPDDVSDFMQSNTLADTNRASPKVADQLWRPAVIGLMLVLLVGCGQEVRGSPEPPASFGPRATAIFGCPSMQGVFAWPPEAGAHAGVMATNRTPWDGGIPVPVGRGEMQIWVKSTSSGTVFKSRIINRQSNVRNSLARQWAYAEYSGGSCTSNMLEFREREVAESHPGDFGGKGIRRGFRLARMKDGALAVGIKTVAYGRTESIFSWGGQSYGQYSASDAVFWSWSKLSKTGEGDVEPAPVDAYVERPADKR
jgi:hypothetical protein